MTDDTLVCRDCMASFEDTETGRDGIEEHRCTPEEATDA